jgi:hypothetical protein
MTFNIFRNERLMSNEEKFKSRKNYHTTFSHCFAMMEMPKLLKYGKIKKRFSHILTISWKSQFRIFEWIKNIRLYGFSTFPHSFFIFIYKIYLKEVLWIIRFAHTQREKMHSGHFFLTLQGGGFIVK